jgi:hypothetical protein
MKRYAIALLLSISFLAITVVAPVGAVNVFGGCQSGVDCSVVKDNSLNYEGGGNRVWGMVSLALGILAGVAVIMIVIGGIRYVTSNGEAAHVKSAKDTILYAVIGLVVAILAYAIVNFVMTSLM